MASWATGLNPRECSVEPAEAPLIKDRWSHTRLVLNEAGELWATSGDNTQGVCLAYSVEHFDRLITLASQFRERYEAQVTPAQRS